MDQEIVTNRLGPNKKFCEPKPRSLKKRKWRNETVRDWSEPEVGGPRSAHIRGAKIWAQFANNSKPQKVVSTIWLYIYIYIFIYIINFKKKLC